MWTSDQLWTFIINNNVVLMSRLTDTPVQSDQYLLVPLTGHSWLPNKLKKRRIRKKESIRGFRESGALRGLKHLKIISPVCHGDPKHSSWDWSQTSFSSESLTRRPELPRAVPPSKGLCRPAGSAWIHHIHKLMGVWAFSSCRVHWGSVSGNYRRETLLWCIMGAGLCRSWH